MEGERIASRQEQKEFGHPHHADTAPISPTTAGGSETAQGSPAMEDPPTMPNGKPGKESTDISDTTAVATSSGVVRRGGGVFKMIHRETKDPEKNGGRDLERTESNDLPLEERKRRAMKRKIPIGQQLRAILFMSWINVLLVFVPVGFALYYSKKVGAVPIFIVNFIAIIPLAAMLSYATEELAIRVGETLGGLLNASFGYV